ncbi:MAG: GNAT family N-acetyltransferase [Jatrophihabitantaceae bacterium]
MAIELSTPDVGRLGDVVGALRDWQDDAAPIQLHPGDLGWYWQFGAEAMAAAVRTWSRDGQLLAIGFLDGPEVLRMTVAPEVWREEELAHKVVADVSEPQLGVLPAGKVSIETPDGTRVRDVLADIGWSAGEPWTPLRRDLTGPVEQPDLRIEVIGSGQESEFTAVHRSAWGSSRFTDELWRTMAVGLPYTGARCLLAHDDQGVAVAGVTVWSAGPRKPGLLEPMGVHADHRGRGYGAKICVAAAAELKKLGSSSALVCTRSAKTAAVATYKAAGFQQLPERLDRSRDA